MLHNRLKGGIAIAVFTLPAMILFTTVVVYPVLKTVYYSLLDWDGLSQPSFVMFGNYARLFGDPDFHLAVKNGLIFAAVLVIYQIGLGSVFALILSDRKIAGKKFFRTAYFLPVVLSITVVCQLWLSILNGDRGLLNNLFHALGLTYRQSWLSSGKTAILAVAFANAWQYMGIHFSLIYAAIKSIPDHYYEAALIDGASSFTAHRKITIPLLAETYRFCLIIAITGGLKAFENMYIMTGGGPGNLTYSLTYLIYKAAFRMNQYGYACASAAILLLQCLVFTILINRLVARERVTY